LAAFPMFMERLLILAFHHGSSSYWKLKRFKAIGKALAARVVPRGQH
jgi:hypothetical protein